MKENVWCGFSVHCKVRATVYDCRVYIKKRKGGKCWSYSELDFIRRRGCARTHACLRVKWCVTTHHFTLHAVTLIHPYR